MPPSHLALTDLLPLPNSLVKIPRLGFGIYGSPTNVCIKSCLTALKSGYRHIDSAQYYQNETEMGEAVRQSGIQRNGVFLTTKILSPGGSADKTYKICLDSVHKIDGEKGYVDLFLLHTPSGGPAAVKEMYQALEKLESEGKARSIGVSNFGIGHIEEMKNYARIWPPHVNQIEVCTDSIPLSLPHRPMQIVVWPPSCLFSLKISLPRVDHSQSPLFHHLSLSSSLGFSSASTHTMQALTCMCPHSFTHGTNNER